MNKLFFHFLLHKNVEDFTKFREIYNIINFFQPFINGKYLIFHQLLMNVIYFWDIIIFIEPKECLIAF